MTYTEAESMFARCRNKEAGYRLASNTALVKSGNCYAVKLYNTKVVVIRNNGTYLLRTGGFYTRTTKNRISMFSPANIYTENGLWLIKSCVQNRRDRVFAENMVVDAKGRPIGRRESCDIVHIKKQVDKIVTKFVRMFKRGVKCGYGLPHLMRQHKIRRRGKPESEVRLVEFWQIISLSDRHSRLYILESAVAEYEYGDCQVIYGLISSELKGRVWSGMTSTAINTFFNKRKLHWVKLLNEKKIKV